MGSSGALLIRSRELARVIEAEAVKLEAFLAKAAGAQHEPLLEAIAALYSKRLREALRSTLDATEIAERWAKAHQGTEKAPNADESLAEAQAAAYSAGLGLSTEALGAAIADLYRDAYLAGAHVANAQLAASGVATLTAAANQVAATVDWSTWEPGHPDAAALADDGGLSGLLDAAGDTIAGISDTMTAQIGDALAQALLAGMNVDQTSALIESVLGDPDRADLIAVTETARAMSAASLNSYLDAGVAQKRWIAEGGACPICLSNESEGAIDVDDDFGSGDQAPPAHPRCRCALSPVVEG